MIERGLLEKGKKAISEILSVLKVARVVCVDDTYGDQLDVDDFVAAASTLSADTLTEILPELGGAPSGDRDILGQQLRQLWNDLDPKQHAERSSEVFAAARLKDGHTTDDPGDASILEQLVPQGMLLTLSPDEWAHRREELLHDDARRRTLFLFDQDLSGDGADAQGGMRIIASVLADKRNKAAICGLLTHTVTPEDQQEQWRKLSEEHGVEQDRFIPVPKQWLTRDPLVFAHILKLVALSPDFTILKKRARKVLVKAAKSASAQVDNISIYDLDHIVFRVSSDEGLWEPDMLFRLHALYHRLEARNLAHKGSNLEAVAKRLRSVSHIATDTAALPAPSTWAIQRAELYEAREHLNVNRLPIELGDIFRKTEGTSEKRYILLAQPCDLMVRTNGKRQPELECLVLAEVARAAPGSPYAKEMEYYGESPEDRWFVKLKQTHHVPCCVLDLCAFDGDGRAIITVGADSPGGLRPAWEARFDRLQKAYTHLLRQFDIVLSPIQGKPAKVKQAKEQVMAGFVRELMPKGPFKGSLSQDKGRATITYNCQRIGRISRARAFDLLMAYTSCLSRPALDRDFGKPLS